MSISLQCEACRAEFQVPDRFAGKRVRCPLCSKSIAVSTAVGTAAPAAGGPDFETDLDWLAEAERKAEAVYEPLTVNCPHCQSEVQSTTQFLRQMVECPTCHREFRLRRQRRSKAGGGTSSLPRWVEIHASSVSKRIDEQERYRTVPAKDRRWSRVLAGLDLLSIAMRIQAGVAGLNIALVGAILTWAFLRTVAVGSGVLFDVAAGGSGSEGGPIARGVLVFMLVTVVVVILRIALLLDRLREALLGLLLIALLVSLIVASQGTAAIALIMLEGLTVVVAMAIGFIGLCRCTAMPARLRARASIVGAIAGMGVGILGSLAAAGFGVTLLGGLPTHGFGWNIRLAAAVACVGIAGAHAALAWALRRMALFCEDSTLQSQADLSLMLQGGLALCGLLVLGAASVAAAVGIGALIAVVYLVAALQFVRLVDRARSLIC